MSKLSERILALRREHGVLQLEIAAAIGVSLRTYQRFEYGDREPTASSIVALAKFYGVSTDYLLGVSDERGEGLHE
ncbi:MAG TPA: helix-turn-helix transcriptional regulator [Candidatus Merdivicinus faecavium]|nr:helix-turn-helix transcriptional regulator [Candidatus Merdivicinus faecavium]